MRPEQETILTDMIHAVNLITNILKSLTQSLIK
uniref:Uncharacterized protein n=1 Tax=Timema cristinae TaxID=61476 RepID=A0A7R9GUW0_TIMCR|nr:unnamed protein product [Timema cristinae]